ncbi:MAG: DUF4838 domain-containing protein [Promethearchaeota archaeon]
MSQKHRYHYINKAEDFYIIPRPKIMRVEDKSAINLTRYLGIFSNKFSIKDNTLLISNVFKKNFDVFLNTFPIRDSYVDPNVGQTYFFTIITDEDRFGKKVKHEINDVIDDMLNEAKMSISEYKKNLAKDLHEYEMDLEKLAEKTGVKNYFHADEIIGAIDDLFLEEGYIIKVKDEAIWVIGKTERGHFYGINTLVEIIENAIFRHEDPEQFIKLPELFLVDFPLIRMRAFHLDLKSMMPTLDYLKRFIAFLVKYKFNTLVIEYEDKFPYKGYLEAGVHRLAFKNDDFRELMDWASLNRIDVIPLIQVFGHLEHWLSKDEYKELIEFKNNSLCPLNPKSEEFMNAMVDQICEAHPRAKYIHIGADEVYELGKCPKCSQFVKEHSMSELYIYFINKVVERVKKHNKIPIMWSDYLIKYPEAIQKLDKDVVVNYWSYSDMHPLEDFLWITKISLNQRILQNEDKKLLDYYKKYYMPPILNENMSSTSSAPFNFPNKVKLLPFYEFFRDLDHQVIGAPSVSPNSGGFTADLYKALKNIISHVYRTFQTNSMGVLITSWATCGAPLDTQKPAIMASSEFIWNPQLLNAIPEKVSVDNDFTFGVNWQALNRNLSLNLFEMDTNKAILNSQLIFKSTIHPRGWVIPPDYNTILGFITDVIPHLLDLENEIYDEHTLYKGLVFALKIRRMEMQSLIYIENLKQILDQFADSEDPSILINNQNISLIRSDFSQFLSQYKEIKWNMNRIYIDADQIKGKELDFISSLKTLPLNRLFQYRIPELLNALKTINQIAPKIINKLKNIGLSYPNYLETINDIVQSQENNTEQTQTQQDRSFYYIDNNLENTKDLLDKLENALLELTRETYYDVQNF